jgi:hypothetical protein
VIDVNEEALIPIQELPAYLQKRGLGRRIHRRDVYRWVQRGVGGVRLEAVKIGGCLVTSAEALQRWVEAREARSGRAVPTHEIHQRPRWGKHDTKRSAEVSRLLS